MYSHVMGRHVISEFLDIHEIFLLFTTIIIRSILTQYVWKYRLIMFFPS